MARKRSTVPAPIVVQPENHKRGESAAFLTLRGLVSDKFTGFDPTKGVYINIVPPVDDNGNEAEGVTPRRVYAAELVGLTTHQVTRLFNDTDPAADARKAAVKAIAAGLTVEEFAALVKAQTPLTLDGTTE